MLLFWQNYTLKQRRPFPVNLFHPLQFAVTGDTSYLVQKQIPVTTYLVHNMSTQLKGLHAQYVHREFSAASVTSTLRCYSVLVLASIVLAWQLSLWWIRCGLTGAKWQEGTQTVHVCAGGFTICVAYLCFSPTRPLQDSCHVESYSCIDSSGKRPVNRHTLRCVTTVAHKRAQRVGNKKKIYSHCLVRLWLSICSWVVQRQPIALWSREKSSTSVCQPGQVRPFIWCCWFVLLATWNHRIPQWHLDDGEL